MTKKKKIDKPDCWNPNNDPYPLCKGNAEHECRECCLYEDMDEKAYDEEHSQRNLAPSWGGEGSTFKWNKSTSWRGNP